MRKWQSELAQRWGTAVWKERRRVFPDQASFARALGVDASVVSRIENGWRLPNDELKMRIASVLAMRVEDLFTYPQSKAKR